MADRIPLLRTDERRYRTRFPLVTAIEYRVRFTGRNLTRVGFGNTMNLSRDGVLFRGNESLLDIGTSIEVSIAWPVKLEEGMELQLFGMGTVVRVQEGSVAVKIQRWEFRSRIVSESRSVAQQSS